MQIKSIMVVDDSEGDQLINEIVINDYDETIVLYKAYDGTEALDIIEGLDEQPSVILLDINMPLMNGFEFLEHYSKKYEPNVVVMLSSSSHEQDQERAFTYQHVKDYIIKPLSVSDLERLAAL